MTTEIDGEANGCTFKWKIKNVSHCWWLNDNYIRSPSFIANGLEGTKWALQIYHLRCTDESVIGFYLQRDGDCSGLKHVEVVNFKLAFLGKGGSILKEKSLLKKEFYKGSSEGFRDFEERRKVFITNRDAFLPEDTLTAQCTMWITKEKPVILKGLCTTTVIETKRTSYEWRISNFITRKSDLKKKCVDYFFAFDIVLMCGADKLKTNMISFDESLQYISFNCSIIDSEGEKTSCGITKYYEYNLQKGHSHTLILPKFLNENRSQYLPNGMLSLNFEFVFSTFEHIEYRKNCNFVKEKADGTAILINEFQALLNDGNFSDVELRTSTKVFPVHRNILSARSAVFSRMFSNDMKEANNGHVDIIDFEDDTVHRMLLYMYTAYLGDIQFESASKLYMIADKYQILSLKSDCSSFFIESLCAANAGETLVLADLHHDDDMKNAVLDYILGQGKQYFCSQEWKDFMNNHNELAKEVMYRKITMS